MTEYLYHVTFARNLPGIAKRGLVPGHGRTFSGGAYESYASGKIFFTIQEGVFCWWGKLEQVAIDNNEPRDIIDRLQIPVVIRASEDAVKNREVDPEGYKDCGYRNAYSTKHRVPASALRVWDGVKWLRVSTDPEELSNAYIKSAKDVVEDDGDEWLDLDLELPKGSELFT